VTRQWTVADLQDRKAGAHAPVWADGDTLTFVYHGVADHVQVCCGVQFPMTRVADSDYWVLSVRIRDLPKAVIGYAFFPSRAGGAPPPQPAFQEWRGPEAPPAPRRATRLQGKTQTYTLDSTALKARRELTVYTPPHHDPHHAIPVVYLADGQSVPDYAALIDPLIVDGALPSVLLVGVNTPPTSSAIGGAYDVSQDPRAQEYLPGVNAERFAAHEQFFVNEVAAWAERTLGAAADRGRRAILGVSNGAAFAIAMGLRHADRYSAVLAFSVAGSIPQTPLGWTAGVAPRQYLVAGTLEIFRGTTSAWAKTLDRLHVDHVYRERVCGHDFLMWQEEFPGAVAWAFGQR
jgi:enterochelin esterase-like enzyme